MFAVYLFVNSLLLFLDIMQTPLNTYNSATHNTWAKLLMFSRLRLFSSLTLLMLIGAFGKAQAGVTVGNNSVIIGGTNTNVNGRYYTNIADASATKGDFKAVTTLGTFDRGTGSLLLSARATTTESGNDNVQSVRLFYRVYIAGTTPPTTYTALNLDIVTASGKTSTWTASVNPPNLLTATSAGDYTLDLYFQIVSVDNKNNPSNFFDRTALSPYRTGFTVTGSAPAAWVGNTDDWFTPSNWSTNGIPTKDTDVTISLQSSVTKYPVVRGTGGVALARTLRLDKSTNPTSPAYILTINSGELQVYGDFQNPNAGLKQNNGFFTLAGTTQTFDGASFTDFRVQGGGTKTLTNRMDIVNTLAFVNDGGILATSTLNSDVYNIDLGTSAQISGENEASYVLGILRTPYRIITKGTTNTLGNIGIEIASSSSAPQDPGSSVITRRTGLAYTGAGDNTTSVSIKRSFTFSSIDSPDNQVFTLSFHYLNAELNDLNASKLAFYRSASGAAPFDALNRASSNPNTKTVISPVITGTLAATFTVGETTAVPLPVTLVSFTATPTLQGAALLRWVTAKELNNKGFGIERSLGISDNWKEVGYLATVNTPNGKSYEYTDKSLVTAPASTQAYYRLRQEDLDGKVSYSPVAAVARQATAASTGIVLSPVPVDGPNLSVSFAEAGQAGQEVAIINTKGQRMLHFTTQNSGEATLSLPVANLAAGVYIVRIQTPGQAVRHARFVKL
jgi:hypothetical protein